MIPNGKIKWKRMNDFKRWLKKTWNIQQIIGNDLSEEQMPKHVNQGIEFTHPALKQANVPAVRTPE